MRYNETGYILGRFLGVEEHRMIDKDFIDHLEEQIHQTVQDALDLKETVVRTVRENVDAHRGPVPPQRPVPPRRPAPPKPYVYPVSYTHLISSGRSKRTVSVPLRGMGCNRYDRDTCSFALFSVP